MTKNNTSLNQDTWLADFTNKILNGEKADLPVNSPDPEMRALTGTLVQLKRAFPKHELDPASIKRMEAQIMKKWREEKVDRPNWIESIRLFWLAPPHRQQVGMAFAMIAIAGILILVTPLLFLDSGSTTATAGSTTGGTLVWIVLGMLGVCLVWLMRRKP